MELFLLDILGSSLRNGLQMLIIIPFFVLVLLQCSNTGVHLPFHRKTQQMTSQQKAVYQFSSTTTVKIAIQWVKTSQLYHVTIV